jgi:ABC-type sugar transport system substrate-binding protein
MQERNQLVAVLLRCENQEFQQAQAASALEAGKREGVPVEVSFAENSPFTQIQQIHSLVKRSPASRPGAIVVELVGPTDGYRAAARAALAAGVDWVEVSGLAPTIPLLRAEFPERFVVSVTTDEEGVGQIHAQQCRALLPSGGAILYVEGPSLQPEAMARRQALEEGLRGTRITIRRTLGGDWTEESAERSMETFLDQGSAHHLAPALVCSQNDAMALGVRRVAVSRHLEWARIPYLGCDGLPDGGQRYVDEGLLTATVVKPVTTGVAVKQVARASARREQRRDIRLAPESMPPLDAIVGQQRATLRP